ncbi:MAG: phosphoribosylformylglycinamidine synthase [Parcubacteria group bacterium Greene0714_7]|nr:MAG: phosphoribosylformylglycinamidine synthase [Parcubacteria group bacterium Greene0714_7]
MVIRIDVTPTILDARAEVKLKAFRALTGSAVTKVHIVDSYLIDAKLSPRQVSQVAHALTNSVTEASTVGRSVPQKFDWAIEVGFLPGVTDNVGTTTEQTVEDITKRSFKAGEKVYSLQVFFIEGELSRAHVEKIVASLHNPLIQSARVYDASLKGRKTLTSIPRVELTSSSRVLEVDLEVSDEELLTIGTHGIKNEDGTHRGPLALDLDALHAIRNYFRRLRRSPTDVELEALAQTWSEHCKHTIFANPIDSISEGIYKKYIKGATAKIRAKKGKKDFCVSVFKDNAGGIIFDEKYVVTHKVETHNSPSALDPFGGAITGIVGVNRDTLGFGLGAKPVANVYGFCFAFPEDTRKLYRDKNLTQEMLPPKRIAEGVIQGINAGGNQSGIPTPNGFMLFDDSYRGKPLVFAGTVGLIPKKNGKRILYEKKAKSGDYIVMVGGRVGLDGIHGATFSSVSLDSGSPATAVQIGDAITQKKFSDAICKEARDLNLYNSITDNGAGGLSSSVAEMARESNGCRVDLEKVPLKYPGLQPWQIWISESQERMTLSVPKGKWKAFSNLMKRRGVEATIIGEFTHSGRCVVTYQKKSVMDLKLEFLHDGLPKKQMQSKKPEWVFEEPKLTEPQDFSNQVLSLLSRHNIASHEFLARQFDHEVQGGSVIKPVQGAGRVTGDAGVFRPLLSSNRGVVLSNGITPYYANLDPYKMATASIDTAIRDAIAVGATLDHLAILDNFCWASSNEPERLWQLKESARACYDLATLYGTPFISGKDSMFNDFKGYDEDGDFLKISILPTLLVSTLGVIQNVGKAISIDVKNAGDSVYVLGETHDELGGSEYYRMLGSKIGGEVPVVDGKKNMKLYRAFTKAGELGLVASAISVGRGGLAVALARMSMAGKQGLDVNLSDIGGDAKRVDSILFSESQGRIALTVAPENVEKFEHIFAGIVFHNVGTVTDTGKIAIACSKHHSVHFSVERALQSYRSTFKKW